MAKIETTNNNDINDGDEDIDDSANNTHESNEHIDDNDNDMVGNNNNNSDSANDIDIPNWLHVPRRSNHQAGRAPPPHINLRQQDAFFAAAYANADDDCVMSFNAI